MSVTATVMNLTIIIVKQWKLLDLSSGTSPDGRLVEIIELKDHPWFVASQFHPEFKSRPNRPQPLFREFIRASLTSAENVIREYKKWRVECTLAIFFFINGISFDDKTIMLYIYNIM